VLTGEGAHTHIKVELFNQDSPGAAYIVVTNAERRGIIRDPKGVEFLKGALNRAISAHAKEVFGITPELCLMCSK
jgi:hypothetical protein